MLRRLERFRHGVHPPEHKDLTAARDIRRLPYPEEIVLPLRQHAGKPAVAIVEPGDHVERGDRIARADGFMSSPVHASASGTVEAIELCPHPDGSYAEAIRLKVDPFSVHEHRPRIVPEWETLSPPEIVQAVQDAGVVGLGGAAFPTHVKLSVPDGVVLDTLIINGCECEPYLTTDHRTMVEYPDRVRAGVLIMRRCLGIDRVMIGIERNKPDAIAAMQRVTADDGTISIHPVRTKYPQGAEKMLIRSLLGREVPSGKLPMHVGVVVQNVASVATIAEVFETGLPLVERIVTVTGKGVRSPGNFIVPVGTRLRDLLASCGGLTDEAQEIVFGGPMMGAPQADLDVPLLKGTTGVVVLSRDECKAQRAYPCIRCGHCLDACPVFLNPQLLGQLAMAERYEEMTAHHLMDCMLCGCCSYTCPSNIPLSQLFMLAKTALRSGKAA